MIPAFSAVIYGPSGAGKSWLLDTLPGPRLILDVEGRTRFTPSNKVRWNPLKDAPPEVGDDDTCIVSAKDVRVLGNVVQWLQSGKHPFRSVGFDSVTEFQKRTLESICGEDQAKTQDWGELLRKTEGLVRDLRDLCEEDGQVRVVAFSCWGWEKNDKLVPYLQGQMAQTLPFLVDILAYQFIAFDGKRKLLFREIPEIQAWAKDGTDRLPIGLTIPDKSAGFPLILEAMERG